MALRAGIGWAEFWDQTPYATRLALNAWADQQRAEHELAVIGAFQTAYFARFEKLGPADLEKALGRKPKPVRQQTDDEIAAGIFGWLKDTEALNGTRSH